MAHAGVLIIDSAQLKNTEKAKLGTALEQGHMELAPSVQVPATAATWMFTSAETVSKGKTHNSFASSSACSGQQMLQHAEKELTLGLIQAFDLVCFCNLDPELQHETAEGSAAADNAAYSNTSWAQSDAAATRRQCTAARQSNLTNTSTLQHALMFTVATSASMQSPVVTEEAVTTLQDYYAFIRQNLGQDGSCRHIGPHTVVSLLRMASACARLHARHDVLPMPDVTLAIFLLQETLKSQVRAL